MPEFWKNKKILVYIALAHHTRFLSPVMAQLEKQGAQIKYVVGQAERSQEITAINLKLNYVHVFDYVTPADLELVQDNYLRLRHTFSRTVNHSFLFSSSPVTVIDKTAYATAMEYVGFRNMVQKEAPDLCFALHELNRWGKMFSYWAKTSGIPLITLQEGLYYGMNFGYTGHLQYSAFNLVWGKRVKDKLKDFEAPPDRIIEVGNTHLANEMARQNRLGIREKKRKDLNCSDDVIILLLFSGEIPDIDPLAPLFQVLDQSPGKKLFIKFHPSARQDQVTQWTSRIPDQSKDCVSIFTGDENYYDLLSASDICVIVQTSTTGLEALFFNKPLIQLKVDMTQHLPYSFTELGVATEMTPQAFSQAIAANKDFSQYTNTEKVAAYLDSELSDTVHAVQNVTDICKTIIQANQTDFPDPLTPVATPDKDWSIIIELPENPDHLLRQLQAVAMHSESGGTFEVFLIEPVHCTRECSTILDTMAGDVIRLPRKEHTTLAEMMNSAALAARGDFLVFMKKSLLPHPHWLSHFKKGISTHGPQNLFGARILNPQGNIHHGGMLVDKNNSPTSLFQHLSPTFSGAMVEDRFQMIDHAMAVERHYFYGLGGFVGESGSYGFLDLCLRANASANGEYKAIYLPNVCLTELEDAIIPDQAHALYFYGKWHGALWESQDRFLENRQLTLEEIETARFTQSMADRHVL